jgi:hypothetical protein
MTKGEHARLVAWRWRLNGNNADYVYQSLLIAGIEVCWPSGEKFRVSQEWLDELLAELRPRKEP